MKYLITLLSSIIFSMSVFSQTITYDDFKAVIPLIQEESFKDAFEKTNQLLSSTQNDSSGLRGIITYMNIFSAAGMVTLDQMGHADFLKNAKKYIGQQIVMAAHPCIDSSKHGFNSLQFISKDGQLKGMVVSANANKTNILCFEYFTFAEPVNPSELLGKNVRCGGTLKDVEVNPNKSKAWISRLHIGDAFANEMTPR